MSSNAFDLLIVPLCKGLVFYFVAAALVRGLVLLAAALVRGLVRPAGPLGHPGGGQDGRLAPDNWPDPAGGCERGWARPRTRRPAAWSPMVPSPGR